MKIFQNKQKQIKLYIFISVIIGLLILLTLGIYTFLKRKAAVEADNIYSSVEVSYKDNDGKAKTAQSPAVKVRKVNLFKLVSILQGQTNPEKIVGKLVIIDPATNKEKGSINYLYTDAVIKPDWTKISGLNLDQKYDLRISVSGYLSKKFKDINLVDILELKAGSLLAGDVNNDGIINFDDYSIWKAKYGQKPSLTDANDFNGDGFINYFDFAMAFGSSNWQKTENSQ